MFTAGPTVGCGLGMVLLPVFNSGNAEALVGDFNVVVGESAEALNRRCLSSFPLAAQKFMLFVTENTTCEVAPTGVACQVCNFGLTSSQGPISVKLYGETEDVLSETSYPGTDDGGPIAGFSWSASTDGNEQFAVASTTIGRCNACE